MAKAEQLMASFNYELAQKFLERAVEQEPNNCQALDLLGDLLLHSGDIENALAVLRRSIELEPDASAEKYMNFGQAVGGDDAVAAYQKGIELMQRDLSQMTVIDMIIIIIFCYALSRNSQSTTF